MKQRERLHFHRRVLLLLIASGLVACGGELREISQPGQTGDIQVVSPLPTGIATEPTIDPFVLTLTAYPTGGPLPTPYPPGFTPQPGATSTVTPIPVVINLAEGLPDGEIYVFFVSRANGAFEKYFVPVALLNASTNYFEDIAKILNLGPGDVIVNDYGLATPFPRIAPR